jgi:hypothetical protein
VDCNVDPERVDPERDLTWLQIEFPPGSIYRLPPEIEGPTHGWMTCTGPEENDIELNQGFECHEDPEITHPII